MMRRNTNIFRGFDVDGIGARSRRRKLHLVRRHHEIIEKKYQHYQAIWKVYWSSASEPQTVVRDDSPNFIVSIGPAIAEKLTRLNESLKSAVGEIMGSYRAWKWQRDIHRDSIKIRFLGSRLELGWNNSWLRFSLSCFAVVMIFAGCWLATKASASGMLIREELVGTLNSFNQGKQDLSTLKFNQAALEFSEASAKIQKLQERLAWIDTALRFIPFAPESERLLSSANKIAKTGEAIAQGSTIVLSELPAQLTNPQNDLGSNSSAVLQAQQKFREADDWANQAIEELKGFPVWLLPKTARAAIEDFRVLAPELTSMRNLFEMLGSLTGADGNHQVVAILNANCDENRAGGFIGSVQYFTFENGKLIKKETKDIYDIAGQEQVAYQAPRQLQLLTDKLHAQDVTGAFPIFSDAASAYGELSASAGEPAPDAVILLDNTVMEEIMKLIGPIETGGITFTADTVSRQLHEEIMADRDAGADQPKTIVKDFTEEFYNQLFKSSISTWTGMGKILMKSLRNKHILLYSATHPRLQNYFEENNWAGSWRPLEADEDYLMVISNNIGGGKTSRSIERELEREVSIEGDGRLESSLRVTYTHQGVVGDEMKGVANYTYSQIVLPQGSEFISINGNDAPALPNYDYGAASIVAHPLLASSSEKAEEVAPGVTVYPYRDRTIISFWSILGAREQKQITLHYRLPFSLSLAGLRDGTAQFSSWYQSVSGALPSPYRLSLMLPLGVRANWHSSWEGELAVSENEVNFISPGNNDGYFSVFLETKI